MKNTEIKNTEMIEITVMYNTIKNAKTPKEALEILSETPLFMWRVDLLTVRYYVYHLWLIKHGYQEWSEYLKLSVDNKDVTGDKPEGYIPPFPYLRRGCQGGITNDKGSQKANG